MSGLTLKIMVRDLFLLTDEDLETLREAVVAEQQPTARARSTDRRKEVTES